MLDPLSILGLAPDAIAGLRAALRDRISVTPETLAFGGSEWHDVHLLTLTSQHDKPLYDVVIGVWSDDKPVLTSLPLTLEKVDDCRVLARVPGRTKVALSADWFGLHGHVGPHGVLLVFVRQLDARQTLHLGLKSDLAKRFHVFSEVLRYEKAPQDPAFSTAPGGLSFNFRPPIDMTITAFEYYVAESDVT